ncbi:MAG: multicopper oxidase family protein [Salaquimonas sp.]
MKPEKPTVSRRRFVRGLAGIALGIGALPFLPKLSLAQTADDYFELTAGMSEQKLYTEDAPASQLWTYNGTAPGPEIRVKKGERVKVRFTNNLEEPTSVHWHGIRISNDMDGVSGLTQEPVQPGDSFVYDFVVPDAGTFWYHAHNKSWNQVARGLYGPLIVDDLEPVFDEAHDLTLIMDDWRLAADGTLDTSSLGAFMDWSHAGRLGNWLLTNGQSFPEFKVNAGEHYRLRLINTSNARVLEIDLNQIGASVIAYDGQTLDEPIIISNSPFLLGPAQRVDLLFTPKTGETYALQEISGGEPHPSFVGFEVQGSKTADSLASLPPANILPEPDLVGAPVFKLTMTGGAMAPLGDAVYKGQKLDRDLMRQTQQVWAFNGVAGLATDPYFSAERNQTVIIEIANQTAFIHAMHVHGHHFRVIEQSESGADEGKPWRDTVLIGPQQTTQIAFVADNPGKWLLHCHMLEHAAAGMNTWFEVI